MHLFEENIKNLGLNIPDLPKALANYVPFKIVGKTMYISGQAPVQNGEVVYKGKVGSDVTIDDGGLLYSVGDSVTFDSTAGNGKAEAQVSEVSSGSISDITVDAVGTGYRVGDAIRFTATSDDTDVASAKAFVSVTGGRLSFNGTDSSSTDADDVIVLESSTTQQLATQNLLLDGTSVFSATATEPYVVNGTDRKYSDSQKYYYPLYVTKARADAANTQNTGSQSHTFAEFPFLTFYMPKNDVNNVLTI